MNESDNREAHPCGINGWLPGLNGFYPQSMVDLEVEEIIVGKKKLLLIFRLVLFVLVECVAMFKCKEMAVLPNKQNRKNFAATRERKEQNQKII